MAEARILGVDGGGTSTSAWIADAEEGRVLGRGRGGPSNIKAVGRESAFRALDEAIASAWAEANPNPNARAEPEFAASCLGLAGFDREDDKRLLREWRDHRLKTERLVLVNDGDIVLAAGTPENWGVAAIAGTGSIAVARAPDGRRARAGGWGHLIGDEGSAYRVVLDLMRLFARRADGRASSSLSSSGLESDRAFARFRDALGIATASEMVSRIYRPDWDRARIAGLAPLVVECAAVDEEIREHVLKRAGRDLAEMVCAAARSLGFSRGPLPLALAGSFLLRADEVRLAMLETIAASGFEPVGTLVPEPALGAIRLARQSWKEALR